MSGWRQVERRAAGGFSGGRDLSGGPMMSWRDYGPFGVADESHLLADRARRVRPSGYARDRRFRFFPRCEPAYETGTPGCSHGGARNRAAHPHAGPAARTRERDGR
ncbi:hypothetical protein FAIPA1_160039 [Frankia sp. AiPs1]